MRMQQWTTANRESGLLRKSLRKAAEKLLDRKEERKNNKTNNRGSAHQKVSAQAGKQTNLDTYSCLILVLLRPWKIKGLSIITVLWKSSQNVSWVPSSGQLKRVLRGDTAPASTHWGLRLASRRPLDLSNRGLGLPLRRVPGGWGPGSRPPRAARASGCPGDAAAVVACAEPPALGVGAAGLPEAALRWPCPRRKCGGGRGPGEEGFTPGVVEREVEAPSLGKVPWEKGREADIPSGDLGGISSVGARSYRWRVAPPLAAQPTGCGPCWLEVGAVLGSRTAELWESRFGRSLCGPGAGLSLHVD